MRSGETLDLQCRRHAGDVAVRCERAADSRAHDGNADAPLSRHHRHRPGAAAIHGDVLQEQCATGRRAAGGRADCPTTTAERLRGYWAENYGGSANRGKIPVLDNGLTFTPIQTANDEAQLNETLRAINEQIAGAFRVPV